MSPYTWTISHADLGTHDNKHKYTVGSPTLPDGVSEMPKSGAIADIANKISLVPDENKQNGIETVTTNLKSYVDLKKGAEEITDGNATFSGSTIINIYSNHK